MSIDTETAATQPEGSDAPPARTYRKARGGGGDTVFTTVSQVLLIIWSALVILPFVYTLLASFKTSSEIFASPFALPEKPQWENYVRTWTESGIGRAMINSIIVVGSALVVVMLLGAMCAYVLARFEFPFRRAIYYLMLAGLTFPVFLAVVPLFFIMQNFGLLGTLPGLSLTYVAFALPFTVFFLYSFFQQLPQEIAEAAAIDGAGEWTTFFRVMLPMAKPGLAAIAIFNFLGLWNQFILPVALNPRPENYVLPQVMAAIAGSANYEIDYGALFAAIVIVVLPVLVIYVIFQRQLQGSVSQGTNK